MNGALNGTVVLDFTTLLPGPLATQLMAQAGAHVVKVERPQGDELRSYVPRYGEDSAYFALLNHGKEIVKADLKQRPDRDRVQQLARECDVLVEQFRPGVMDRLGLGFEDVRAENPDVIYCSITGYGQSGPLAAVAGHDLNYMAAAGLLSLTDRPTLPPVLIADLAGAAQPTVIEILLALVRRARTGEGARIDVAMARNLFNLVPYQIARGFVTGDWPEPGDDLVTGASPRYGLYPAADGRTVAVAAIEDRFWARFCELADLPETATHEAVANRIRERSAEDWAALLESEDTCVNVVRTLAEAVSHPQFAPLFETPISDGAILRRLPLPSGGTVQVSASGS
jgi:crotonobetainyl-CoA:carnitine CoA-transferase CaiB-like acyl-CoA transferase